MGLRIGDAGGAAAFLRTYPQRVEASGSPRDEGTTPGYPEREEMEISGAGFGDGTVSVPSVAVRALGANLSNTRQLVPTVEEARAELRERLAEERAQTETEAEPVEEPRDPINVTFQRNEAAARAQARQFINRLNDAASAARDRAEGRTPAQAPEGPRIRVAGETFAFQTTEQGPPQVDIRV